MANILVCFKSGFSLPLHSFVIEIGLVGLLGRLFHQIFPLRFLGRGTSGAFGRRLDGVTIPLLSTGVLASVAFLRGSVLSVFQKETGESLRLSAHSLLHTLQPLLKTGRLRRLDNLQALAGQCLGGLAVDGRLGEMLQLFKNALVKEDQSRARAGVSEEAGQPGGSKRLQVPGLDVGQQPECRSHPENCMLCIKTRQAWVTGSIKDDDVLSI